MLIVNNSRVIQRCTRFSGHCNTNCKLHTDEGDVCFSVAFEGCLSFVRRGCCYFNALQIVRLFLPSFAVIVCAWVRLCAFARCLRLFFCRLSGFYCFFSHLSTLHAFARLVAFLQPLFVLPPFGDSTTRRGKGMKQGEKSPRLRGCVL